MTKATATRREVAETVAGNERPLVPRQVLRHYNYSVHFLCIFVTFFSAGRVRLATQLLFHVAVTLPPCSRKSRCAQQGTQQHLILLRITIEVAYRSIDVYSGTPLSKQRLHEDTSHSCWVSGMHVQRI